MGEIDLRALFAEYANDVGLVELAPGSYRAEIVRCSSRKTSLVPVYKILDGPEAGKHAIVGRIHPGRTEGGRAAFFRKLEKFGLGREFFRTNPTLEDVARALVGCVGVVEV